MEILGIGPSELLFILIIALIVLGPRDMQKAGRTIGKWLRRIVTSDGWRVFQQTSREIQTLPNRLMREAALEDQLKDVQNTIRKPLDDLKQDLRQPIEVNPRSIAPPASGEPPSVAPPPPGEDVPPP